MWSNPILVAFYRVLIFYWERLNGKNKQFFLEVFMRLGEAQDLILPFLDNIGLSKLESENEELADLLKQIQAKMQTIGTHPLGQSLVEVDEETEKMFLRYAEICEENLKF